MTVSHNFPAIQIDRKRGRIFAILLTVRCVLRSLPLFVSARPKTPLRVLCVIAFDTVHTLRTSERLPNHKSRTLAALLDFGACANASLDNKVCCPVEYQSALQYLEAAGIGAAVHRYEERLIELERRRPSLGGGFQRFQDIQLYRESVARLSLGMVAATTFGDQDLEVGVEATYGDNNIRTLFRIVMQCQIIDDVLDYSKDMSAGLPGFLTASASLAQAIELTDQASRQYADVRDLSRTGDGFPLRLALSAVSAAAVLIIGFFRWRQRVGFPRRQPRIRGL